MTFNSKIKQRSSKDFYHQPTTSVKIISTASLNSKCIQKVKRLSKTDNDCNNQRVRDNNSNKQSIKSNKNNGVLEVTEVNLIDSCESDDDFAPLKKSTLKLRQYTKNKEDKAVIRKQLSKKRISKELSQVKTEKRKPKSLTKNNLAITPNLKMQNKTSVNGKAVSCASLNGKVNDKSFEKNGSIFSESSSSKQKDIKNDVDHIPNKRKRKKNAFDSNFITPTLTVKKRKKDKVQATIKQLFQKSSSKSSSALNGCVGSKEDTIVNLEEVEYIPTRTHKVFLEVIDTIMLQKEDWKLFEGADAAAITDFKSLKPSSQDLYAHLYQRKQEWIHENKLAFFTQKNLKTETNELIANGFLISNNSKKLEVSQYLELMNKDMLTKLCKWLNFSYKGKEETIFLVNKCVNNSKKSKNFFNSKTTNFISRLLDRMSMIVGTCYFVVTEKRKIFDRCQLVYHSVRSALQENSVVQTATGKVKVVNRRPGQLVNMLLNNMGKVLYPKYEIFVKNSLFHSRDELIEYEKASSDLELINIYIDSSNFTAAITECTKYDERIIDSKVVSTSDFLPRYARRCTVPYIVLKILNAKVDALEKLKRYSDANKHIENLLEKYKTSGLRGYWFERLVINYSHLKNESLQKLWLTKGIDDPLIAENYKLAFQQKYNKIMGKNSQSINITDMDCTLPQKEAPVVEIKGVYLSKHMQSKSMQFIREDGADTVACSVEELAVLHYRDQGYLNGIHKEGTTFMTLLGLLMWDIIYLPGIPDVFRHKYQTLPLDFRTQDFYKSRKSQIDKRIKLIEAWKSKHFDCEEQIKNVWNENYEVSGGCVSWDIFSSVEQAIEVAVCMGRKVLSGVIKRILCCTDFDRSGLPDLFVWNPETGESKIVEVKAPLDKLSSKQEVWIHALLNLGAKVELCKIVAKREAV